MTDQPEEIQSESVFSALRKALQYELEQLKTTRQEISLFGGVQVGSFADHCYYRFEIPEDLFLQTIEPATFSVGQSQPVVVKGKIIGVDNQFMTVALPTDFGPFLPETKCVWSYEEHLQPVLSMLPAEAGSSAMAALLFDPSDESNANASTVDPQFLPDTPPNQAETIRKVLQNRVSVLWGPILTGKTHVLALLAANYVKAGKRVLFLANANDHVDVTLLKTVELGQKLGVDLSKSAARLGFPSPSFAALIGPYSFEQQIAALRNEKRKIFQERVTLLQKYWLVKNKQSLNEDFYARIQSMRDRLGDLRKQSEQLSKDLESIREIVQRHQGASVIEKLKKGYTKEELALAQKQLGEKQQSQKRLQSLQQSLSNEITLVESNAPITADEMKEFRLSVKRIEELGGIDRVTQAVDEFVTIDEASQLKWKQFVCTSVWTALVDSRMRGLQFDLILVDDAETVYLPALAGLATLARDRMLIAGDPFQLEPESFTKNALAERWLHRDIFLHVARTEELNKLFDWTDKHAQWAMVLGSHFATTPKLSLFTASVLFDDKINVFTTPQAKGSIYFLDTSDAKSSCKQYVGRKKILPYNEYHTKKVVECVKHALLEAQCKPGEIGVILPFAGPTLFTKLQLRMLGLTDVEVGTPQSFRGRRKRTIIFDTTMAGVDYTMKQIDDKKAGEHKIARLFNTIFSSVGEDFYIVADMNHFRTVYKDRLFTRLLMLLQAEADQRSSFTSAAKKFESLEWDRYDALVSASSGTGPSSKDADRGSRGPEKKEDAELALKMKMLLQQQKTNPALASRNIERETHDAVLRILGLRTDLNLLSQYIGGDLLFRTSLVTEQASKRLPRDFCQGEREFREITERWNTIIYEMSGGSKTDLSYFSKKSPEARVRHDIRNLRTFYSSDVEAAIEEGKQKVAVEVSKIFQELLGKSQPSNPTEWSTSYLNFLSKLESYLTWISEQLRR
ncbi:MAG TPA: AAA domain-containing protein [Bacteroidota bacterium]